MPLTPEQTMVPPTIEPISTKESNDFPHDSNRFDQISHSFQEASNHHNPSKAENSSATNAMVKLSRVLPMQSARQQRIHVFRPLFVYRQEQAMRRRATARPPIDPDRLYPYSPPYPYDPYYYHQPQQHYASSYYPDYYYEPYPYPSDDYAPDYWYPYH